jgi:hypothetical protein
VRNFEDKQDVGVECNWLLMGVHMLALIIKIKKQKEMSLWFKDVLIHFLQHIISAESVSEPSASFTYSSTSMTSTSGPIKTTHPSIILASAKKN